MSLHSLNTTNGVQSVGTLSHPLHPIDKPIIDPANNLGYGLGRLLRAAFEHCCRTPKQPMSTDTLSSKRTAIYQKRLQAWEQQCDKALAALRTNLHDTSSLKKIEALVQQYAGVPKSDEERSLREECVRFLEEKIAKVTHPHLRTALSHVSHVPKTFAKRSIHQSWPASFDLTRLDGSNGFTIPGVVAGGGLGFSVNTAGDVNGDGKVDLVLGAYLASSTNGKAYVIFGQGTGWPASFNLSTLNGTNGFVFSGQLGEELGVSVSTAGDINGDGKADLLLGAWGTNLGGAYVIFGQGSGWPASVSPSILNGANGFAIPGILTNGGLGASVSTAGDVNGDGKKDIILGAFTASSNTGMAYVIFGQGTGWPASFNLSTLNGANGFAIPGITASGFLGYSVSTAGDINGDGKADIILSADIALSGKGEVYVIFGQATGWPASFNLSTLDGLNGFVIPGVVTNGVLGESVSTAGDVNGDGKADLVLGAGWANRVYVIFGQSTGWPASFSLSSLNGNNGFAIPGVVVSERLGSCVSTAGDVNGDGKADLVLGAYPSSVGPGEAYVIFGQSTGWPASFDLSTLNGTNGFAIPGVVVNGSLGASVRKAGDINGDGRDDLVLGADQVSSNTGVAYVIFGSNTSASPVASTLPTSTPTSSTQIPTPTSVLSFSQISSLVTSSSTSGVAPPNDPTIGIAVGVSAGVLVLGGVVGVIVFLRSKKKACFAQDSRPRSVNAISISEKAYA